MHNSLNLVIAATAALLILVAALVFISINPALLYGAPALLWAVAGIVRAINGSGKDGTPPQLPGSATRRNPPVEDDGPDGHDDPGEPTDDVPAPESC